MAGQNLKVYKDNLFIILKVILKMAKEKEEFSGIINDHKKDKEKQQIL